MGVSKRRRKGPAVPASQSSHETNVRTPGKRLKLRRATEWGWNCSDHHRVGKPPESMAPLPPKGCQPVPSPRPASRRRVTSRGKGRAGPQRQGNAGRRGAGTPRAGWSRLLGPRAQGEERHVPNTWNSANRIQRCFWFGLVLKLL